MICCKNNNSPLENHELLWVLINEQMDYYQELCMGNLPPTYQVLHIRLVVFRVTLDRHHLTVSTQKLVWKTFQLDPRYTKLFLPLWTKPTRQPTTDFNQNQTNFHHQFYLTRNFFFNLKYFLPRFFLTKRLKLFLV